MAQARIAGMDEDLELSVGNRYSIVTMIVSTLIMCLPLR